MQVPEILPFLSDPLFVQSEHLLFIVRRKSGQVCVYTQYMTGECVLVLVDGWWCLCA